MPGGMVGVVLIAGLGLLSCLAAFLFGLNPPASLHWADPDSYRFTMMLTDACVIALPFAILARQKRASRGRTAA